MPHLMALIDGSAYSQSVCAHASWVASRLGASVALIHVLDHKARSEQTDLSGSLHAGERSALLKELAQLDAERSKLDLQRGRVILEEARQCLADSGITEVTPKLRHGDLIEAVKDFEKEADLILVGRAGESVGKVEKRLGSNLERVVRSAGKPVMVASIHFDQIRKMLIAFDGEASAMKAVRHIATSPLFTGLPCLLYSVGQDTPALRQRQAEAAAILQGAGLSVETGIEAGEPEEVIRKRIDSDGIDLLVMGAYSHSRLRSLIIGSTTTAMVRSCLVTVMLFH